VSRAEAAATCAGGYDDGADAGGHAAWLAEVEADPDEGGVDEGGVDEGGVDEGGADDEDVLAGGDVGGAGDVAGVTEAGVVAGDEYVLAGWDVPEYGAELAGDGRADGVVDAEETAGLTDTDAGGAAGDVCAAGDSIRIGALLIELTTKAVAPLAPTMPPRIRASTSGFTRRRGGRALGAGGGAGGP
jgi:hypothetical protein